MDTKNPTTFSKLALLAMLLSCQTVLGDALPTVVNPTTGAGAGDFLGAIKGYVKDAGIVLGLIMALGLAMDRQPFFI